MNDNLMSPKRQVEQGAAAGTAQDAQCGCMACKRIRCESSSGLTWHLGRGPKQQLANQQEQAETGPDLPPLPPELLAMKRDMDPMVWQEVLKQRALALVREEMDARAAARVERSKGPEAKQVLAGGRDLDLDVEGLIRNLPNPDAAMARFGAGLLQGQQMAAAKERAEKEKQRRSDVSYELVGETETQRFYKAEVQDPAEPMSPVTAEFKMQHAAMDCLGEGLERLEDRLQAVLSGNSTGWPAPEDPTAVDTPLMLDLRHVSNRLQVMVQRLNELSARVIL